MLLNDGISSLLFGGQAFVQVRGDSYGAGNPDLDQNLRLDWHWAYNGTDSCWPTTLQKGRRVGSLVRLCEDPLR